MARKIKPPDALPSKAWLMSFGDTMTTLLAFFIVLCSMAEDQTGANLHTGTGSFVNAVRSAGLPGAFGGTKSDRAVQLEQTNPLYAPSNDNAVDDPQKDRQGPDSDPNDVPSKDREQEEFSRFLNEIERSAAVEPEITTQGETTFDFFEKLNRDPPYLPENYHDITTQVLPLLRKDKHRVELVVWAATPSRTARSRSSIQAGSIVNTLVQQAGLAPEQAKKLLGTGRTWPYRDLKRPIISLIIHRMRD